MEDYIARCLKTLKEMEAPLEGWICTNVIDEVNDTFTCELCDCKKVRFVHVMEHDDYYTHLAVGCICAGVMESDLFAAEERDRKMKNRAKRKRNFIKHTWKDSGDGVFTRTYKKKKLTIKDYDGEFYCYQQRFFIMRSNADFRITMEKLFDFIDPLEDVME